MSIRANATTMSPPQSPRSPCPAEPTDLPGFAKTAKSVSCPPNSPSQEPPPSLSPLTPSIDAKPTPHVLDTPGTSQHQQNPPVPMSLKDLEIMQWDSQNSFAMNHDGHFADEYHQNPLFDANSNNVFLYAQEEAARISNNGLPHCGEFPSSYRPRSFTGIEFTGLPYHFNMADSHPPAAYQIVPQKHYENVNYTDDNFSDHMTLVSSNQEHLYEAHFDGSQLDHEDRSGYQTPYSDLTRANTPHELGFGDDTMIDKELPYAQLIYKALLQAEGHTMILRDIYEWFQKYTDKASSSETKGWQNSIRHNLSMNGAFEKVEQPGDDSRRGFMWRLTEAAIREGVKSTTRYRSKQPNKRGHRQQQQHPQPQRQASGARGGHASRRSANLRRSRRVADVHRSEPYASRSVPTGFTHNGSTDRSAAHPQSPYHSSEASFGYPCNMDHIDSRSPLVNNALALRSPMQSYPGSPMSQGMMISGEAAYTLVQSPNESMFSNSPSPFMTDEPRTPHDQVGMWPDDLAFGGSGMMQEMAYPEYTG